MSEQNKRDLSSVPGNPFAPVSLQKFLETHDTNRTYTILVDGTGNGIAHDADNIVYVTPEECSMQALYYRDLFIKDGGNHVPAYLHRHLHFLMLNDSNDPKYKKDMDIIEAIAKGELKTDSDEFKHIVALITYCNNNAEAAQIIGLIQIICGSLSLAKKQNKSIRLYLDRPETALHPKRQSRFMSWLHNVYNEYFPDQNKNNKTKTTT